MGRAVAPVDNRQTSRDRTNKDRLESMSASSTELTSPSSLESDTLSPPPSRTLTANEAGQMSADEDLQEILPEEDEIEDSSLGYSDDSASLSDVYFLPGDDLARPGTYHDPDPYVYSSGSSLGSTLLPSSKIYNSISSGVYGSISASGFVGEAIQEDTEVVPQEEDNSRLFASVGSEERLIKASVATTATIPFTTKDRLKRQRRQKRHMQKMKERMKEQAARELAVSRVRGRPQQVTHWQDPLWAFLFMVQLVAVILCALRFGFGVILFKNYINTDGNFFWEQTGHRFLAEDTNLDATSTLATNTSLSDIIFHVPETSAMTDDGFASQAASVSDSSSFTIDYKNVLALTFFTGLYACVLAYLSFGFMLIISRSLIQIMLIFSIVVALGWGLIGLSLDPYGLIADMGFGAFLLTLGYTMFSWNRIPFAATNLYTALCAMRCTADITILGLMSLVVAFGWCLLWCTAFVGIVNSFNSSDCDKNDNCHAHVSRSHIPLYLLFVFSFHWTTMVIKNVVRVTVASAIGTWWFRPSEIGPFCTAAVVRPLVRSLTKSFGSICLGSLIVQPAQMCLNVGSGCCCLLGGSDNLCTHPSPEADEEKQPLLSTNKASTDNQENIAPNSSSETSATTSSSSNKQGAGQVGVNDDDSAVEAVGLCRQCCACLGPLHRFVRSSNRWTYTYIGMYGYSFAEAGDRALQLFQTRQWLEVVEDSLIQNVLLMSSVVIGGSSGVFAVVVEETDGYDFTSFHQPIISAFVIGSVLGYVLSNILLLGVVGSAVNTILVCFAAGPFEFDKNHPRLSRQMREVWSQQVWEPPV